MIFKTWGLKNNINFIVYTVVILVLKELFYNLDNT